MSLATRVIPVILARGRQMIKGQQFSAWRSVGLVEQAVRIHQQRGVDELLLLDIGATPENRGPDLMLINELTAGCFMPMAVGGGVKSAKDVRDLLKAGADKVVVRSAWETAIAEAAPIVGSQAIVAALDVTDMSMGGDPKPCSEALIDHAVFRAKVLTAKGAGELIVTRMEYEGMMCGYDLPLIKAVSEAVPIPVIAHGGAGTFEHMVEAIRAGASAVAAGAMFQFTDATPKGAALYMKQHGIETRI